MPGDAQAFVDGGVKIAGVAPGGLADRAGMTGGDLLVSLAGMPVKNLCELSAALRRAGHASTVELEFVRGGARGSLDARPWSSNRWRSSRA